MADAPDADAIERGRWLFAQDCVFVAGAARRDGLPDAVLPEVAFAGRSNVGKSSLVNALTGRGTLARTSGTPGRTRQINFFRLRRDLMLADLPGYGYAKASKTDKRDWTRLVFDYLRGRPTLRRACLLVDARRGLGDADEAAMRSLDEAAVSCQIVLTKCDKAAPDELDRVAAETRERAARHPAAHPLVLRTSARRGAGIAELRAGIALLADGAAGGG